MITQGIKEALAAGGKNLVAQNCDERASLSQFSCPTFFIIGGETIWTEGKTERSLCPGAPDRGRSVVDAGWIDAKKGMRVITKLKHVSVLVACSLSVAVAVAAGLAAWPLSGTALADPPAQDGAGGKNAANAVENRIRDLHDKLKVTEAQAGQWDAEARTMRSNAQAIDELVQERRKNAAQMTAVADLRAYQEIVEAHAKGAKRLGDVFEKLYDTMSDEQKALADSVFRQHKQDAAITR